MNKRVKLIAVPEPPPPRPLHWAYYLLYLLALIAGLWQHGQPYFTMILVAVMPVLAFVVYIPRRYFSPMARSLMQHALGVLAIIWIIYRVQNRTPMDLMLVEGFALMGAGFAFSTVSKSYGFVLLMAVMLFGYGALLPPRELFIFSLAPGLLLFFLLLYQTRVLGLAKGVVVETRRTVRLANWRPIALHASLAVAILPMVVSVLPQKQRQGSQPGVMSVSYKAQDSMNLAPKLNEWFRTPNVRRSATGTMWQDGENPTELGDQSETTVPDGDSQASMSANGNGSGQPGKDLVMQVRSPVKLYWLGRLYDRYDGLNWTSSPEQGRSRRTRGRATDEEQDGTVVSQTFVMSKWLSPQLFSAYRARLFVVTGTNHTRTEHAFPGDRLEAGQPYPATPFTYEVESVIGLAPGDLSAKSNGWVERQPEKDFIDLPDKEISDRLRALALELTKDADTPIEKAMAIRDYLRTNYGYTTSPDKVPEGREPVDYFLFEMKNGHCQYFAAAAAVLCRLNGLPSRVATGFSPGNYNTLTGMFEVYEYHAHAWTQVFIPNQGWITVDGTPASAQQLQLRTTPLMIGSLRDPFTDDWRITTPETSRDLKNFSGQSEAVGVKPGNKDTGTFNFLSRLFGKTEELNDAAPPETAAHPMSREDMQRARAAETLPDDATLMQTIAFNFKQLLRNIRDRFVALASRIELRDLVALMFICVAMIVGLIQLPRWLHRMQFRRRTRQCERWFNAAETQFETAPAECIMNCYRCLRELLVLSGRPRRGSQDLYAYGTSLQDLSPVLGQDALSVFMVYSRMRYSREIANKRDAITTLERTREARAVLLKMLEQN